MATFTAATLQVQGVGSEVRVQEITHVEVEQAKEVDGLSASGGGN